MITQSQQKLRDREATWRTLGNFDFTKHRFRNAIRNGSKFFRKAESDSRSVLSAMHQARDYRRGISSYERGVADAFKHIAEHLDIDLNDL